MEKNNQNLHQDTFLKKYVQEIELDTTKADFTASVMHTILAEEKQSVFKTAPLISKKIIFASLTFLVACFWFVIKGKSTSKFQFSNINFSFIPNLEIPNLFGNLTISSTIMYTVITFSILVFVQIAFLKNHFGKQFNS